MDEDYWMYVYKVALCPAKERHDWSACPYAHRGERAARRCPRGSTYSAEPCPDYNKRGACPKADSCPMAHSVFESWLHPSRFRTQLCCFGTSCRRRICFFAHTPEQLRAAAAASSSNSTPAAPVMRRTQAVVPAAMIGLGPLGPSSMAAMEPAAAAAAANQAAAAAAMQQQAYPYPSAAVSQAQAAAAAGAMAAAMAGSGQGWVLTGQGWAPVMDPAMAAASAAAAAAAMAQQHAMMHGAAPGGDVACLTAGLGRLMLHEQVPAASQPQQGMLPPYLPPPAMMGAPGPGQASAEATAAAAAAAAAARAYGGAHMLAASPLPGLSQEQQDGSQLYRSQQGGWQ